MAVGKGKGIQIIVGADYNGKDLARAQRDLDKLKREAAAAQSPIAGMASKLKSMLGPALIAAGAAAGAFAVKLGVDGVKAAIEDQKTVEVLAQTLDNLGLAYAETGIEDYIAKMESATGIADESLRPAFGRLVIATKDVDDAMALMEAAMDAAIATGQDFKTVYEAMAKAVASGSVGRLSTYGIVVDQNTIATEGMTAAILDASEAFGGAAANEAKTLAGRMRILTTEAGNVQEAFGYGFLEGVGINEVGEDADDLSQSLRDMQGAARELGTELGRAVPVIVDAAVGVKDLNDALSGAADWATSLPAGIGALADTLLDVLNPLKPLIEAFMAWRAWTDANTEASRRAAGAVVELADDTAGAANAHRDYRDAAERAAAASGVMEGATSDLNDEIDRTNDALAALNGVLGEYQTMAAYEAAWDSLKKQIKETGGALGDSTDKQRQTTSAAWEFIEATGKAALSQWELNGATGVAEQGLENLASQFDVTKMSPSAAAMLLQPFQALISDLDAAGYDVTALQLKMDALQSKTINIQVIETWTRRNAGGDGYDWRDSEGSATGGLVTGSGSGMSDSIPMRLSNGEFVVQASAVRRLGVPTLMAVNRGELPMTNTGGRGGLVVQNLNVTTVAGERAEESVPRALRRLAFVAGL